MLLQNEFLIWRGAGAAIWQILTTTALYIMYQCILHPLVAVSPLRALGNLFNGGNLIRLLSVLLALAPAIAAHTAVLCTRETPAKHRSGMQFMPAKVAVLFRKLAARATTPQAAATWLAFFIAHTISAVLGLLMLTPVSTSALTFTQLAWISASLSLVYQCHIIYWSRDVLVFPSIQRHRYFRMKQQLPATITHALVISTLGTLLGAFWSFVSGTGIITVASLMPILSSTAFIVLCWLAGTVALEVVFTERLLPHDYGSRDCLQAMEVCLNGKNGQIMADFALLDLSGVATDQGKKAWRREEIFADDSGAKWKPHAQLCLGILNDLSAAMGAALPSRRNAGGAVVEKGASGGAKWNAVPTAVVKSMPVAQKMNLDALSAVCCGYQRGKLALRALCNFAVASLTEDRFGVVQLVTPSLGDILMTILGAYMAVQQFIKQVGAGFGSTSVGPWRGTGDSPYTACEAHSALYALQDELSTALYQMVDAFGPSLKEALAKATVAPAVGTKAEAVKVLESVLNGEL